MSGDLEDFLRRAAQRRQAKAAQQQQPKPKPVRQRPQYSDRHSERVVDAALVDEPVTAEIVEEDVYPLAEQRRRLEQSRQAAAAAEAEAAKDRAKLKRRAGTQSTKSLPLTGITAEDLLRLLSSPQGVRQAILLREVLDRPEHRW